MMIRTLGSGEYKFFKKNQTKILQLASKAYAWVNQRGKGELLITAIKPQTGGALMNSGNFRLYEVKDEVDYSDNQHLELSIGEGKWQSYILTSLPSASNKSCQITPTDEVISVPRVKPVGLVKVTR